MTDPPTHLRDQPVQPPTVPPDCIDPPAGQRYWQFMTHLVKVTDGYEVARLFSHPQSCAPCLKLLVKEWLRIRRKRDADNGEGKEDVP